MTSKKRFKNYPNTLNINLDTKAGDLERYTVLEVKLQKGGYMKKRKIDPRWIFIVALLAMLFGMVSIFCDVAQLFLAAIGG